MLTLKIEEGIIDQAMQGMKGLEAGKDKKTDCLLELPEGIQPHLFLAFGPVKPALHFDL